jgi:MFS family permease
MTNFDPDRQPRFFYGWVIVWSLCGVTGIIMTMGGSNMGFFVKPMREELGFAQVDFGWMNTARVLAGAVTAAMLGRMMDRYGPRYLIAIVGLLITGLMIAMASVTQPWQAVLIFGAMGALGSQGGGQILTAVTPAKWFIRQRTRAMSYVYLGIPLSVVVSYPLTQRLIDAYGWQDAWIILGIAGGAFLMPVSLLLLRRQPEDIGLLPDGVDMRTAERTRVGLGTTTGAPPEEYQFTRAEALRTPAFWALTLAFGIQMFTMATISVFRVPYFQNRGISDSTVSWLGPVDGLTSVAIVFVLGTFVNRFGVRRTATGGFILLAFNNFLMLATREPVMMFVSSATWGVSLSILTVMQNTLWADFYGRRNLGSIRGYSMMGVLGFSAIGAPLTGYVADATGSLAPVWWASAVGLIISAFVVLVVPKPQIPESATEVNARARPTIREAQDKRDRD